MDVGVESKRKKKKRTVSETPEETGGGKRQRRDSEACEGDAAAKRHSNPAKLLSTKAMKERLLCESRFIVNLWKTLPIPLSSHLHVSDSSDDENAREAAEGQKKKKFRRFAVDGKEASRATSLQDLHRRLEEMKGKKLEYRAKMEKKRLKIKLTKKQKKEERRQKNKATKARAGAPGPVQSPAAEEKAKPARAIVNNDGKMVFSRFDFTEGGAPPRRDRDGGNPQKALHRIEQHNERLRELEEAGDADGAKELRERAAWRAALQKSSGVKVKDDPALLRKTARKKEERKKKSSRVWEAREAKVKQQIDERQQKRTENIAKRKQQKAANKIKRAAKKGRFIQAV